MKKNLKSAGLPIGVFALAIGSAFATNAMKNAQTIVPAYQKMDNDGLVCELREATCDINGTVTCTWIDGSNTYELYAEKFDEELNTTVCTLPLYQIIEP